ncbi:hypothetical protein ACSBR2_011738 [Camellia fascicularis]
MLSLYRPNLITFALISSLEQHRSKRRHRATHPFPSKASGDGDARSSEISKHQFLSLVAEISKHLPPLTER